MIPKILESCQIKFCFDVAKNHGPRSRREALFCLLDLPIFMGDTFIVARKNKRLELIASS